MDMDFFQFLMSHPIAGILGAFVVVCIGAAVLSFINESVKKRVSGDFNLKIIKSMNDLSSNQEKAYQLIDKRTEKLPDYILGQNQNFSNLLHRLENNDGQIASTSKQINEVRDMLFKMGGN